MTEGSRPWYRMKRWWILGVLVVLIALGVIGSNTKTTAAKVPAQVATSAPTTTRALKATTTAPRPTITTTESRPTTTTTAPPRPTTTTTAPRPVTSTTAAPPATPTATTVCYTDPEGNCYRAGEFCPDSLHGQTVQGESGPILCTNNNGWRWEPA